MASKRVFTEDEVEDLIAKVMKHKVSSDKAATQHTSAKDEELLREQDTAILRGELTCEKKECVWKVARDTLTTATDKIQALCGDSKLSPFQLMKLTTPTATENPTHREPSPPDLLRQVLGNHPSVAELARYSEIAEILAGTVRMGPNQSMMIDNKEVPGDLVRSLRYLICGTRRYARPPEGVASIAALLRHGGIKRSRFPPGVCGMLGGVPRAGATAGNTTVARRASGTILHISTSEPPRRQLPTVSPSMWDSWHATTLDDPPSSSEETED